jgi:hypothetical protein
LAWLTVPVRSNVTHMAPRPDRPPGRAQRSKRALSPSRAAYATAPTSRRVGVASELAATALGGAARPGAIPAFAVATAVAVLAGTLATLDEDVGRADETLGSWSGTRASLWRSSAARRDTPTTKMASTTRARSAKLEMATENTTSLRSPFRPGGTGPSSGEGAIDRSLSETAFQPVRSDAITAARRGRSRSSRPSGRTIGTASTSANRCSKAAGSGRAVAEVGAGVTDCAGGHSGSSTA